jgi:hypothetical protein
MRMNARLMFSASPKPTASAMRSTGSVVDSMRPRAISARSRSTTPGRGAGLRPECATELASAHPDCFRQIFEGRRFGDVIAGVADGGGNTIVLRCQIDRGREL